MVYKKVLVICFCVIWLLLFSAGEVTAEKGYTVYEDDHVYYRFTIGLSDLQNSMSVLQDVTIYSKDHGSLLTCSAVNVGILDMANVLTGKLDRIRSLKISAEDLNIKESTGEEVSITNVYLEFEGNLEDMMQAFAHGRDPMDYHTLAFAMDGIKIRSLRDDEHYVYSLVSVVDHISLSLKYYGDLDVMGKLNTPFGNGELQGSIVLNERELETSEIKKLQCILSDLSSEMRGAVAELELKAGKKLPRRGNDLIIEIKGALNLLLVKGWDY